MIDLSLNETFSRTALTSGTTLLAVLALLVLGGPELRNFSLAMAIGILVGTYSTLYVASPLVLWVERWRVGTAPTVRPRRGRRDAA